jgi:pimeloyl-ACP methyl ester carboxylesterase
MNVLLWILLGLLLFVAALGFGLSFYLTRRFGLEQIHTPAEYGLDYEAAAFPAADGLTLRGVWIPAPGSERAVVILHGHGGSMDADIQRAPHLHKAGFNVLLFDFRAHGRSDGRLATFGYLERQDVLGAVKFLKSRRVKRIGLLGFSYGGIVSMLAAPLCPDIHAVISDGGPARLRSAIEGRAVELRLPRLLGRFLGWLIVVAVSVRLGVNLFRFEPARWVGKIAPRPILFIHGELDKYLPDFNDLYAAAGEPKQAWRLPGVDHTKASEAQPEEYYRRVVAFFEKNL